MTTARLQFVPFAIGTLRALARQPVVVVHVLREIAGLVRRHRTLLLEMTRREIVDPFAGSMLGVFWSILHPLILMGVYVLVFTFVFRIRVERFDQMVMMVSALLPWMALSQSVIGGCAAVRGKANLVKQVVFPVEVLPFKSVLAAMLPQLVGTAFLVVYTLAKFRTLPWTWALWPALIACQTMFASGLAFAAAAVGVYWRDLREILQVLFTILFYATPVLYPETLITLEERGLGAVFYLNPLSYYVWPFRDVAYHGSFAHPAAWIALPIASVLTLVAGYRVFRKLKPQFGNAL